MRKTCWTPRRDRLVCPLCEVGELLPSGQGSARCTSCANFVSGTMLEVLSASSLCRPPLGNHACEECGYLEIRHLIGGVFHCPELRVRGTTLQHYVCRPEAGLGLGGHVQQRRGRRHRKLVEVSIPGKMARAFREGAQTCPERKYGTITWEEFLDRTVPSIETGQTKRKELA